MFSIMCTINNKQLMYIFRVSSSNKNLGWKLITSDMKMLTRVTLIGHAGDGMCETDHHRTDDTESGSRQNYDCKQTGLNHRVCSNVKFKIIFRRVECHSNHCNSLMLNTA